MKKYFILFLLITLLFCFFRTDVFAVKIIYPKNSLSTKVPEMIRPQVYDTADDVPLQEKITEKNYQENLSSEQEQGSFESAESNKNNFWRLIWFLAIIVIVLILIFKKWYNKFAR